MSVVFTLITVIGISIRCIKGFIVPYSKRRMKVWNSQQTCHLITEMLVDVMIRVMLRICTAYLNRARIYFTVHKHSIVHLCMCTAPYGLLILTLNNPSFPSVYFSRPKQLYSFWIFLMFVNANTSASGFICFWVEFDFFCAFQVNCSVQRVYVWVCAKWKYSQLV